MCEIYKATAMFEMIKERYGVNMNLDELGELRTTIDAITTAADAIRVVPPHTGTCTVHTLVLFNTLTELGLQPYYASCLTDVC